ncbi:Plant invertase/pectin methylesterase inhibitor superfamily [Trifolium repens]|nr:Plant invertase/pectin methylesterase inhibitor superfamily [Trifolium repens]
MKQKYGAFANVHDQMDDDSKEEEELIANIVIMGVSLLLLGLVTIAFVSNIGGSKTEPVMKNLESICSKTESSESCLHVLKHIGDRATVLEYIKASLNVTLEEFFVVNIPKPLLEKFLTPLQAQSYRDCLELLNMGTNELNFLHMITNSAVEEVLRVDPKDIMNSLSAIISYQQTCANELVRTNSYEILGYSLSIPILLTRMTLAIVENFVDIPYVDDRELDGFKKFQSRASEPKLGDEKTIKVVAKDGSGNFTSISESIHACAMNTKESCVIYVKKGKYEERVVIPNNLDQVFMYGDGPMDTIVTGVTIRDPMVVTPFQSATFVVKGKGFICKDMGFIAPANVAGAPALLVLSDRAVFFNCLIDGEEGSLYAVAHRQFYRDCEIRGSVDIIKGDSATLIQNSKIIVKHRNSSNLALRKNVVSAQTRLDKYERTGLVIQNCTIVAEQGENGHDSLVSSTCLGAPRNEYSRTIIMESFLGDVIRPKGWCRWSDNYGIDTATFREYDNRGPGAENNKRVHWESYRTISQNQRLDMKSFTAAKFIQADQWLKQTGIPYESGFLFPK